MSLLKRARSNAVKLRVLTPADYDFLFEQLADDALGLRDRLLGRTPSPEEFVRMLWFGVLAQFVVEARGAFAGVLVLHRANRLDRYAYLTHHSFAHTSPDVDETALRTFVAYVFDNWELRKLYTEVPGYRRERFLRRGGGIFREEGCLREHDYWSGRFWARYVFSLERPPTSEAAQPTSSAVLPSECAADREYANRTESVPRDGAPWPLRAEQRHESLGNIGTGVPRAGGGEKDASRIAIAVPSLVGRRVRLRPVEASDYEQLYTRFLEPEIASRWQYRFGTPSPEAFRVSFWENIHVQYLIERRSDSALAGLVTAYDTHLLAGYTYISMVVFPEFQRTVWPLEAGAIFVDYLFRAFNLRKLYGETSDFNYPQFGSDRLFTEEARLRKHVYADGRYWDMRVMALYRETWIRGSDNPFGAKQVWWVTGLSDKPSSEQ